MPLKPSPNSYNNAGNDKIYNILAGQIFDSYTRKLVSNQVITVDRDDGIILDVQDLAKFAGGEDATTATGEGPQLIDLRHLTILPGLVDAHVHLFLHAYSETSWNDQLTKESLAERTIRAGVHARKTLMAGFTTVRDLGTEGAADADIALRKCLSDQGGGAIIPGPRYYCSSRAIVCTGSYGPKSTLYPSQTGIEGVTGAEVADGVEGCIRAVRRQIGVGADWIKIYADYRFRSQMADISPEIASRSFATFNDDELKAMIDTAHAVNVKVAVHTTTPDVIKRLLDLGPDTIEHGGDMFDTDRAGGGTDVIEKWTELGVKTTWVPTLAVYHSLAGQGHPGVTDMWARARSTFQKVLEVERVSGRHLKIVCGGDTGAFPHGDNGRELVLMRELGAEWGSILSWATLSGWECVRGMEWEGEQGKAKLKAAEEGLGMHGGKGKGRLERNTPFGAIRKGWAGDLVGIEGALDGDVSEFEQAIIGGVMFVMKGGAIYKWEGREVL